MPPANPPRQSEARRIDLPDAEILLWAAAWSSGEADELLTALRAGIDWQQEEILMFGQRRLVPRLIAWHGDPGAAYTYSGTTHTPLPWSPVLASIKERVEALTGHAFNSVLLNRYRDGRDGMGWHADDEPELGRNPVIASASFGVTRRFQLRHRRDRNARVEIGLGPGDLLLMAGATQHHYLHAVPKTTRPAGERVNLTFRAVVMPRPVGTAVPEGQPGVTRC